MLPLTLGWVHILLAHNDPPINNLISAVDQRHRELMLERRVPELIFDVVWKPNPWTKKLALFREFWVPGPGRRQLVQLPIVNIPPPAFITGFERIKIRYIDSEPFNFFRVIGGQIKHLYIQKINFPEDIQDVMPQKLSDLFNVILHNVSSARFLDILDFNCVGIRRLRPVQHIFLPMFNPAYIDPVIRWSRMAFEGQGNGQVGQTRKVRMLVMDAPSGVPELLVRIKQDFLESTRGALVDFMFYFTSWTLWQEEHTNLATMERLTFYTPTDPPATYRNAWENPAPVHWNALRRFPLGTSEHTLQTVERALQRYARLDCYRDRWMLEVDLE